MNKKTTLIIVIVAGLVIITLLVLLFSIPKPAPSPETGQVGEPSDAVQEITEGTTVSDIEKDLEALSQEQEILGNLESELNQLEQELQSGGL